MANPSQHLVLNDMIGWLEFDWLNHPFFSGMDHSRLPVIIRNVASLFSMPFARPGKHDFSNFPLPRGNPDFVFYIFITSLWNTCQSILSSASWWLHPLSVWRTAPGWWSPRRQVAVSASWTSSGSLSTPPRWPTSERDGWMTGSREFYPG